VYLTIAWANQIIPFHHLVLDPQILVPFLPPLDNAYQLPQLLSSFTAVLPAWALCNELFLFPESNALDMPGQPCLDSL
jgi:hypothetical protein